MTESTPHVVVLGAGPAGLGAAYKLRQSGKAEVTVLERGPQVGGNAGSFELAGQWVDFGSHRLHPSCEPEILADIRSLLGEDLLRRPRHGRIRLRGQWIHFPPRPVDLLLRLDRGFAFGALKDMILGGPRNTDREESFATVLEQHLGPTISQQFYLPYAEKIWGLDPRRLAPVQARRRVSAGTFGKLLRKVFSRLPGVEPVGYDYFFYPRRGFGQISDAYSQAAVEYGANLVLSEPVVNLEAPGQPDGQWTVVTQREHGQRSFHADKVWSTIPISSLAQLILPAAPAEVLEATETLRYRAMILVYLQVPVDRFSEFDAHYFPDKAFSITRLSEPKNYTGRSDPRQSTILCAELPCSDKDPYWRMSTSELADVVVEDLRRAGLRVPATIDRVEVRRLAQAYPIYEIGFEEPLDRLDIWLAAQPGLITFGRQGLFVHDNTHHALSMAYSAVSCLANGEWDDERWAEFRRHFETHVVED